VPAAPWTAVVDTSPPLAGKSAWKRSNASAIRRPPHGKSVFQTFGKQIALVLTGVAEIATEERCSRQLTASMHKAECLSRKRKRSQGDDSDG